MIVPMRSRSPQLCRLCVTSQPRQQARDTLFLTALVEDHNEAVVVRPPEDVTYDDTNLTGVIPDTVPGMELLWNGIRFRHFYLLLINRR